MKAREKAEDLYSKMYDETPATGLIKQIDQFKQCAKQCALICTERNINIFTELVNKMDNFSNESRQVIYQLIENEQEVKREIEKINA